MGRPLFNKFLISATRGSAGRERGLWLHRDFLSWDDLLAQGRERARLVRPQCGYLVDPSTGFEGFKSFFAVATTPDTFLLWAKAGAQFGDIKPLAPGLYEIQHRLGEPLDRPLWGILTSGSSGVPKVPVGYADMLELVALHYESAVFEQMQPNGCRAFETHATCLPLEFSASFFMSVLPALFFKRDLLVFPPHDWRSLCEAGLREPTVCLSVPSITAAGSLSITDPLSMPKTALMLGAGYITGERVRTITARFRDVSISNIYGTAETGAISIDANPGHCSHVGFTIAGKPAWLRNANTDGVGLIVTTGPDCRSYYWTPGSAIKPAPPLVDSTDYGHFDGEGHLCLDGRVDEGQKLNGVIVYPRVVERHILQLDGVLDARVKVASDGRLGERLTACVVGDVQEETVREHCMALDEAIRPSLIECMSEREAARAYSDRGKL